MNSTDEETDLSSRSNKSRYAQPGSVASKGCRRRSAVDVTSLSASRPATSASGSTASTSLSRPGCAVSSSIRKPRSYVPRRSACRVSSPMVVRSASRTFG